VIVQRPGDGRNGNVELFRYFFDGGEFGILHGTKIGVSQ
jgi:hypothetical protein